MAAQLKKKCPALEEEPGNVQAGRRGTGRECESLHETWSRQAVKRFNATGNPGNTAVQAT